MTEAETILKLIETVDPADTAKLDEIDARVEFLVNPDFHGDSPIGWTDRQFWYQSRHGGNYPLAHTWSPKKYTSSLDALQAIMPKGWCITTLGDTDGVVVVLDKPGTADDYSGDWETAAKKLKTEPLARLHAIIQAIAYERQEGERG